MTPLRLALVLGALAPTVAPVGGAQPPEPGSELEVYLVTMGPGDPIWSKFGHNALGIRDRRTGSDVVYNWGTFDFRASDFLVRFLRGRMRYWVQAEATTDMLYTYRAYNRDVWFQELNLAPAQRVALRDFVENNAREENKYYDYDYFLDNCSTRVRDVLDLVLSGSLRSRFGGAPSGRTFRDEARRLTQGDFWTYTGIDIGLGTPTDREMTRWEAMFLPGAVREAVREVQVPGPGGQRIPLVAGERQVVVAERSPEPALAARHLVRNLALGLAAALAVALATSRRRTARRLGRTFATAWCAVSAMLGVLLVLLWAATRHIWAYENVNLLLFHPLWALLVPAASRAGRTLATGWARRVAQASAVAALVAIPLAVAGEPQNSAQVVALALPVHTLLLVLVLRGPARDA